MNELTNITRRSRIKDANRKLRKDSETQIETPDFLFTYEDSDSLATEIAEWYTYSEEPEFVWNLKAFENSFKQTYGNKQWKDLTNDEKKEHICRLLNLTEMNDKNSRDEAYRSILYLAQGSFGECDTIDEYNDNLIKNVLLLYECDTLTIFIDLFYFEVESAYTSNLMEPKTVPSICDNTEMRVVMSVLYTIIEVIRTLPTNDSKYLTIKESLRNELNSNMNKSSELFSVYLFHLITRFCNQNMAVLPIKKIMLLLWKTLLLTLGGLDEAFRLKNEYRKRYNIPLITENSLDIINRMPPATPPPNPIDIVNDLQQSAVNGTKKSKKNGLTKQTRGIDNDDFLTVDENGGSSSNLLNEDDVYPSNGGNEGGGGSGSPRPKSPETIPIHLPFSQTRSLPWKPKVRLCELEAFLDQARKKFLGYGDLFNDNDTLIGLPYPIHESVRILKQHLYISLNECQIKTEEKIIKYPLSQGENFIEDTPVERLYVGLLQNLPQCLICLLKILLTSVPQTRSKSDSLQIMSDLFPEDLNGSHIFTIKLTIDTNRHKEILIKAISAILLLMLKHFKVNHVYQFEFISQHLLFANCVPLILKFFNLNVTGFIQSKNNNNLLDFPNCVIGKQPELTPEILENGDSVSFRWRNVFSCINLLRILNKLTKYKRSRIMMLVIFKSAPILKKILRVKQTMLQLYALKLLKMQTRHLGRQWRKTNMSTMSAIYQKVRHRLNDDWAYGNEQEAQPWDFQSDECALRSKIDRFNQRRYKPDEPLNPDDIPVDNSLTSCLNKEIELPNDFEENYEKWLVDEVLANPINWDLLSEKNVLILH